jgi:RNA polymerase sigma-70 factor (sigma-E family)
VDQRRREAFDALVAHRSAGLLRFAFVLTRDWALAEDLLQTSLARTWTRWDRIEDVEAGEAYARRVIATTHATWWRRRWRGERPSELLPETAVPDRTGEVDDRLALHEALMMLSPRQRTVLALRYFADQSEEEVARTLSCSLGTVKSTASRALARLRELDVLADEAVAHE